MRFPADESRRTDARRVMEVFPSWLVVWGAYTRQFWAFPCFDAPRGTVVSSEPGVYFLGLPWQSRRGSSFIWGVWHDAKYIADHIHRQRGYLAYAPAPEGNSPR